MAIELNARQTRVLYLDDSKNIRIDGEAGSGKSLVALYRALYFAKKYPEKRILLTCFNRMLAEEFEKKLVHLVGQEHIPQNLVINPIITSALSFLENVANTIRPKQGQFEFVDCKNSRISITSAKNKKEWIEEAYEKVSKSSSEEFIIDTEVSNIIDEISWIQAMGISDRKAYYEVERVGRGKFRVVREKRDFIYEIFEEYRAIRSSGNKKNKNNEKIFRYYDFEDIGSYVKKLKEKLEADELRVTPLLFDTIILDEYQDLSTDMFYIVQTLLIDNGHFELIGDSNQSIFGSRISWSSIGIDARKMDNYQLQTNHRNTIEIQNVAKHFLINKSSIIGTHRHGRRPKVKIFKNEETEIAYIAEIAEKLDQLNRDYIIILLENDFAKQIKEIYKNAKVDSINRVKGLEYKIVIVPQLCQQKIDEIYDADVFDQKKKQIYVALTRANDELLMTCTGDLINLICRKDVDIEYRN